MNRTEVMERLTPITNLKARNIDHSPRTRIAVSPDMVVLRPGDSTRTLELTPEGVKGMANFAGFPISLFKELTPDTIGRVATELLHKKHRYSVIMNEGRVTDFTKVGEHHLVNPERVLRTIDSAIGNVEFHRVMLFNNAAQIEVVGEKQLAVAKGDLIQAGAKVAFSPIGTIEPEVESYVLRLACINGMTTPESIEHFHFSGGGGGEGDDLWQWFRQSVHKAYQSADRAVNRFQRMRERRIPAADRSMILEGMMKQANIRGEIANAVRAQALEQPPQNEYDMVNLITWASSHLLEDPARVRQAQLAASVFASQREHRRTCPTCHHTR